MKYLVTLMITIGSIAQLTMSIKTAKIVYNIHDFQAINKYGIHVLPCQHFNDLSLYKFIDFEFTKGPPKAGHNNIIRVKYKILQDMKIESAWGQLYYQGPFGIWIKVWKGTKKFNPNVELKKSDKEQHSSNEVPLGMAFAGKYKGKAKILGNGGKEIGCFDFRVKL